MQLSCNICQCNDIPASFWHWFGWSRGVLVGSRCRSGMGDAGSPPDQPTINANDIPATLPESGPLKKLTIASLLILLPALAFLSGAKAIAATYTTNFPSTENPISEGGWWIGGKSVGLAWSDFRSVPGLAFGTQLGTSQGVYDDSIALLTGTWGPDQTVQATVKTINQNDGIFEELEIRLRSTVIANRSTGYECNFSARSSANAYVQIVRWNGPFGNFTLLDGRGGSSMALHNGDTIACTINGSTITAYINGVQKLQVVDSTFTSGNPGIGAYLQNATGVNADYGFTSFTASDGINTGPPAPPSSPGTISLSASSYSVNEASGSVAITAVRTGGSSGAVGVSYATSDGTAVAGSDYVTSIGNLSWADGDASSKTFGVPIVNDTVAEGNETFTVLLRNPTGGATLGSPSSATVTILDGSTITMGQTSVLTSQGSGDANTLQGIKASLSQTATIQSMSIYFKAASGHARLSIYDDQGNHPGTLKAQTAQFTPSVGWNTQNVTSPVTLGAGNYWLIWQTDNNSIGVAYTPGSAYIVTGYTYGAPPATFPSGGSSSPDESIYATLSIGGANAAPTVATPASASPNPVPGLTTTLSVLGADDRGEANLTYTWATTGTPPAPVTFSANGTNAAKTVGATFTKAGSYSFQVTIRDQGNLTVTSSVTVTVASTLTGITVIPASASVAAGGTQAFTATARDQFGAALSPQPALTWTVSGGGTISATGLFTAGSTAGGPYTVTASSGGINGTASVTVTASAPIIIGNTTVLGARSGGGASDLLAYRVSLAQTATIQSISIYTKKMGGKLYLAIYGDNGGRPGSLRAATAEFTPSSGWNKRDVTSQVSLSPGTYWLVFEPSSNSYGTGYDSGGPSNGSYERATTYGPMPSTFPAGGQASTNRFSLYATLLP